MADVALYTTIYPGVESYLPAWFQSIEGQSDQDIDLCIGLDNISSGSVCQIVGKRIRANWYPGGTGRTPTDVRNEALLEITKDYRAVILVDSDDVLLPERVAAAKAGLQEGDAVCCAMTLMDGQGRDVDGLFDPRLGVDRLAQVNVFGFGNTAYRSDVLRSALPVSSSCVLMDWNVISRLHLDGFHLKIDPVPRIRYRQYERNTARVLPPFTADQIKVAARLVLTHHELLSASLRRAAPDRAEPFERAAVDVQKFVRFVEGDGRRFDSYVTALNHLPPHHVWWSCVAHPLLEAIWKN